MEQLVLATPIGNIGFIMADQAITQVDLYTGHSVNQPFNPLTENIARQAAEYFSGQRQTFDLPYRVSGTAFREKVWAALSEIPYGSQLTYGGLAQELSSSARAIGGACRHNPVPLIIPCHRIIAANGIGGFSGAVEGERVNVKQWLLDWESRTDVLC